MLDQRPSLFMSLVPMLETIQQCSLESEFFPLCSLSSLHAVPKWFSDMMETWIVIWIHLYIPTESFLWTYANSMDTMSVILDFLLLVVPLLMYPLSLMLLWHCILKAHKCYINMDYEKLMPHRAKEPLIDRLLKRISLDSFSWERQAGNGLLKRICLSLTEDWEGGEEEWEDCWRLHLG